MIRLGLLGGTFDPIHRGHLDVAEAARRALNLERVVLVPCHVPPHRRTPLASPAHRFAMAALAVQPYPDFLVSDLEMADASPSYTSATLGRLGARGMDTRELFLITGADAFAEIRTWKDYPTILDRCHFVTVSRPGRAVAALRASLPELASRMLDAPCGVPTQPTIFLVDSPTAPVSSTEVRRRARAGEDLGDLVPAAVAAYITKHGLYSDRVPKDFA